MQKSKYQNMRHDYKWLQRKLNRQIMIKNSFLTQQDKSLKECQEQLLVKTQKPWNTNNELMNLKEKSMS